MFEESDSAAAALVDRIRAATRAENRAAAQSLVAIDELFRLRLREVGAREDYAMDTQEAVAVEVAAALRISQGLAAARVADAIAMRSRLPEVGAVFAAGEIDYLIFAAVVSRTELITDRDILTAVDAKLAVAVARWPSLSRSQLIGRVDRIVARHDRDAVRRRKKKTADRWIEIWDSGDGVSEIRGFLRVMTGRALEERLDALAATVCNHDLRSPAQRRADAIDALVTGADRLACECDRPDCTAATKPPVSPVVIHVVADQSTVAGRSEAPGATIDPDDLVPAELVAELARTAKLVPLVHPGDAPAECGYRPSAALADFVRCRDMTCRFPGCDRPAVGCDLDHTTPFAAGGRTHASNLKCLCRLHHLAKTFGGWRDRQLRDGTVIWTSPSGQTYVTTPGSALLFPTLCRPTGALASPTASSLEATDRTGAMPKRQRTRAQNKARRIATERRLNRQDHEVLIGQQRWEQALAMATDTDPPPF